MVSHPGKPITIYDVAELVGKADEKALTPKNIRSGFAASGICPFNRDVFGEDEFLSSYVSDRPHCSHDASSVVENASLSATSAHTETQLVLISSSAPSVTPETISPLPKCFDQRKKASTSKKREKVKF